MLSPGREYLLARREPPFSLLSHSETIALSRSIREKWRV
jgi:hypothetical protein